MWSTSCQQTEELLLHVAITHQCFYSRLHLQLQEWVQSWYEYALKEQLLLGDPPFSFLFSLSSSLLLSLPSLNAICGSASVYKSGILLTESTVVVNWLIRLHSPRENKCWFLYCSMAPSYSLVARCFYISPTHTHTAVCCASHAVRHSAIQWSLD